MSATENLLGSLRILLHTDDATPDLAATIENLTAHRTLVHDMTQEHAERIARLDVRERGSQVRRSKTKDRMRAKLQAEEHSEQAAMRDTIRQAMMRLQATLETWHALQIHAQYRVLEKCNL